MQVVGTTLLTRFGAVGKRVVENPKKRVSVMVARDDCTREISRRINRCQEAKKSHFVPSLDLARKLPRGSRDCAMIS